MLNMYANHRSSLTVQFNLFKLTFSNMDLMDNWVCARVIYCHIRYGCAVVIWKFHLVLVLAMCSGNRHHTRSQAERLALSIITMRGSLKSGSMNGRNSTTISIQVQNNIFKDLDWVFLFRFRLYCTLECIKIT